MKDYLEYLEIPIVDFCNLNCKGCSHFSPLAPKDDCMSFEEIKADLTRLKELIPHIWKIRILGGEPLLHKDLPNVLYCVRELYLQTDIRIVTNGLLLKKMKAEFWKAVKDNGITIDISMYPPTVQQWDTIREILNEYGTSYECTEPIKKFRRRMTLSCRDDIECSFKECVVGNQCTCLYKGRIAACPAPFVVRHFNRTFNHHIQCANDSLDIYDSSVSTEQLIKFVNSPLSMCGYCTQPDEFDWEVKTKPEEKDWVIS